MTTDMMVLEDAPVAAAPSDSGEVSGLVRLAIEQKVPVEILERLVVLQERVTERNAEMAMAKALAAFQAECPSIARTKTADVKKDGRKLYDYQFAPLDEIARVIRPHLAKNGLSYVHDAEVTDRLVTVTCTLQHVEGAKRTATFTGPIDTSGGKNPIQQVSSARSYGRRYSLIDVLGLTTGDDDDGAGAGGPGRCELTDRQAADLDSLMDEVAVDRKRFLKYLGVNSISEIRAADYPRAVKALEEKRRRG